MKNKVDRYTASFLLLICVAIIGACAQKAQLAEYKKYKDASEVPKISVQDAKKEVDAGTAIIIDSRGDAAYKNERIAGSISISSATETDKVAKLPKDKKLIVYCSCATEGTSAALSFQLNQAGIANTYALTGGTKAWHDAGYPMASGD
ncbi:MAG: rhodanese-like domain-containing protein [Pyrinomonadaceae bacterium]